MAFLRVSLFIGERMVAAGAASASEKTMCFSMMKVVGVVLGVVPAVSAGVLYTHENCPDAPQIIIPVVYTICGIERGHLSHTKYMRHNPKLYIRILVISLP